MEFHEGDTIEVLSNKVEQPNRVGTVRRVVQDEPAEIEVEWEDGHTSLFVPAAGNVRIQAEAS